MTHQTTEIVADVVVVGAGYAGVIAANRLARRHRVVLVAERDVMVQRIRLHEYAAGTRAAPVLPLARLTRAQVVIGRATRVTPGEVELSPIATGAPHRVRARHVLLATGSVARGTEGHQIATLDGARALRERLDDPAARVVVRGGGLTGIELAAELATGRAEGRAAGQTSGRVPAREVVLVDPKGAGAWLPPRARAAIDGHLHRSGVEVVAAFETGPGDVVVDCTGFRPQHPDGVGPFEVDVTLAVPGLPGLWAAGDAATVRGWTHQRMGCATATPMGAHAADNIARALAGQPLRPLRFGYAVQAVSLGRRAGIMAFVTPDDEPTGRLLTGRLAALGKEAICRYADAAPHRFARAYRWPAGGLT